MPASRPLGPEARVGHRWQWPKQKRDSLKQVPPVIVLRRDLLDTQSPRWRPLMLTFPWTLGRFETTHYFGRLIVGARLNARSRISCAPVPNRGSDTPRLEGNWVATLQQRERCSLPNDRCCVGRDRPGEKRCLKSRRYLFSSARLWMYQHALENKRSSGAYTGGGGHWSFSTPGNFQFITESFPLSICSRNILFRFRENIFNASHFRIVFLYILKT